MRSTGAGLARATSLTIVQTLRLAVSMTCCMEPERSMQNTMSTLGRSCAHSVRARAAIRFMAASISFGPLTRGGEARFPKRNASVALRPRMLALLLAPALSLVEGLQDLAVRQLTEGPKHHFFGYIGHVRTVPWNESGRWLLALRTEFQDRLPTPDEAADILLLDTTNGYAAKKVDETRAWNFQQGTMLFWNPAAPETQFFFNDRDAGGRVFCALFDVPSGKRVKEFRFEDTPIGNGGVSPQGMFAGINYGRLARLRPVTGYPGAFDWNEAFHPDDDGVFTVDVATG